MEQESVNEPEFIEVSRARIAFSGYGDVDYCAGIVRALFDGRC